ncbi:MAG: signal peptidase II [Gammaproteobacteria bacterium]
MHHALKWYLASAVLVMLDQWTKALASTYLPLAEPVPIGPLFNLTLVHNTGAAFSLLNEAGGWQRWLFIVLALGISAFIGVWLWRLPREKRWVACALALILGGALGNLWDRMMLGYVVDFIDIYYQDWHWPAFNLADSAITVGAAMLVLDVIWLKNHRHADGGRRLRG